MISLRPVFLLCLLAMLSACASFTESVDELSPQQINWKKQQKKLAAVHRWSIAGRVAVQTRQTGGQADFNWQQHTQSDYAIRLQAPLGAGTIWLNGSQTGVNLRTSDGESVFDTDADALLERINGWPLPVSGLRYWVFGLPSANSTYEITHWNQHGLPEVIRQDGWRIEFRKYAYESALLLPHKLFISRLDEAEVDVRLIVRQWSLQK